MGRGRVFYGSVFELSFFGFCGCLGFDLHYYTFLWRRFVIFLARVVTFYLVGWGVGVCMYYAVKVWSGVESCICHVLIILCREPEPFRVRYTWRGTLDDL
ncbi:hypothetical protein BZA05DRAFT_392468 [Tricharina praecox]|uniref:uncharacterized protein n=1 Tax=Tricharina praecox TaxID=43433 RepID=UPI00222091A6|nr:uncharacterized protein BZA05DRAFT_392468 [Tricharina praecox]KAI5854767.1 hypothetical protein BZA05DRAFT_392468 [Tricharina praecox]